MKIDYNLEEKAKFLKVQLPVKNNNQDIPYDFPLRNGDWWNGTIDIDSGKILEWPNGEAGILDMKVVDEGSYYLLDANMVQLACIEDDYVPNKLIPPNDGAGDYIFLRISKSGIIMNWYENPSLEEFISYDRLLQNISGY